MKATKIDWCDCTVNPVVGCPRGCEYCYAKRLNDRFKWIEDFSEPQFFPERLKALESKTPKSIFMDRMSDWDLWDYDDYVEIMRSVERNPQHNYIFLTKENEGIYEMYKNHFYGLTVTKQADFIDDYIFDDNLFKNDAYDFLSVEPIFIPITIPFHHLKRVKQVIIGAETGNRKGKVIPRKEWIDDIVEQCDERKIRVFMKESLREIMGADFRQDRLIWEVCK
jgi:protein gp37